MTSLTQEGIHCLKSGDRPQARELLLQAVSQDPKDIQAWLWLSGAVDSRQERIDCLQRVLAIDPDNRMAASGMAKLNEDQPAAQVPASRAIPSQPVSLNNRKSTEPPPPPGSLPDFIPASRPIPSKSSLLRAQEGERALFTERPSLKPTLLIGLPMAVLLAAVSLSLHQETYWIDVAIRVLYLLIIIGMSIRLISLATTSYTLTTRSLIITRGLFKSKNRKTIPLSEVSSVTFEQAFFERPFGIGDVLIESNSDSDLRLSDLSDCVRRANQILRLIQE